MHSNKFSNTTVKKAINTPKIKKSNVKKLPFRKTFIDPLTPKLSQCPRLFLWSNKSLSAKKLNNVFLNSRELKNVTTGKFRLFSNDLLQKSSLPGAKVIGCTDYSDRRNIFSYYGFYTPHLSSNFDLRWNRKIMRKFGMQSLNVFKNSDLLTTNEIFKMSKDVDSLFPILGKSTANSNNKLSEEKLSKITYKLKSDDERQKRFREGTLTETDRLITFKKLVNKAISSRDSITLLNSSIKKDLTKFKYFEKNLSENWYPSHPSSKLFRDPALWHSYQMLASRYTPPKYLYWFHRRVSAHEARDVFSVFGSKYSKINTSPKFSNILFDSKKESQLNILMLKKNIKLNLSYYFELKERCNKLSRYFVPFYLNQLFMHNKLKFSFNTFLMGNSLSCWPKTLLFNRIKKNNMSLSTLIRMPFLKTIGDTLKIKNFASVRLLNCSSDLNLTTDSSSKIAKRLQVSNLNSKFMSTNLNLLTSYRSYFNFNAFKMSRFALSHNFFSNLPFNEQQTSLPHFLHKQLAFNKFQIVLSSYFNRSLKLQNSMKPWQLRLSSLYKKFYITKASIFNNYRLLLSVAQNSKLKTKNNFDRSLVYQISNILNGKKVVLPRLEKTLYGKQHFYFRKSIFGLLRRTLNKHNSIFYFIAKGRWRKLNISKRIFKPTHLAKIGHVNKVSSIETLSKLRQSNYNQFRSNQWKNNLDVIITIAVRYINRYKDIRLKLKNNKNPALVVSLKRQLFSIRWVAMKLLPLIIALKKALLSLKSKTYTSNFKTSFITCTSYQVLSTISGLINFPLLNSNISTSNFSSVSSLNLSHMLSETRKLNYLRTFIGDLSVRNLYNGFDVIRNKSFFPAFNSIKSFAAINSNLINSTLKKLYINNLAKSNLLFNNNLKSRGVFVNSFYINKNKTNIRGFKQILSTFISKSNYYDKKKLAFKLSAYRRWNYLLVLQSLVKGNSENLNSQQQTVWLNNISNFFKPYHSNAHPIFKLISKTSIGRILPHQRYVIPSNLNANKNLYLKMIVDRSSFFVCHKSLTALNISLVDSQTGQSMNFLNNSSIDAGLYKNVVVDILSSENNMKYNNCIKFFNAFSKELKDKSYIRSFSNKLSSLRINAPKYTRFNIKSAQPFFVTNKVITNSTAAYSYSSLHDSFSKLRVSVIKTPVFIRKVEPQHTNVTAVFKNIMLHDIYRDKTNYLRLSWSKPDISFELPKWLFSSWDEESKQLFCWDILLKLSVYRQNQFKNYSLFSINSPQYLPLNSLSSSENIINKSEFESYSSDKKDKKYKLNIVRKYYRGELPTEKTIVELLSNFSNIYTSPNDYSLAHSLTYKNRYVVNKLLKVFDTGDMLKKYSDSAKLAYLKAALVLINKKKKILTNFKHNSYDNLCFNNYSKVSIDQKLYKAPFAVDNEPLLKFHLYRVEMPLKAFLQKMDTRKDILKNINNNFEVRKNLKKFISLKNSKVRNNRIIKSENHGLRENYKMLRRTENAFGLSMFRKSYKNTLWRQRLRNYTYRVLNHNFKSELETYVKKDANTYFERTVSFRQRSRWRWFKKTRRRELFPPTKIPKASKNSWTLSLRRFYKHKLIMRKYIFHSLGNINYKQFYKIYDSIKHLQQNRIFNFINKIESRLDMFMLRLNFGKTALSIHQLIRHGHVKVNHQTITFPQYQLKTNDQISLLIPDKTHDYYNSMYKKNYIQNSFQLTLKNAPVMRLSIHAPARFFALLSVKRLLFFRYKRIHFDLLKKNGGQFSLTHKGFHLPLNNFLRLQFGFMYQVPSSVEAIRGSLRITNVVNYDVFEVLKYRNPR